MKEIRSTLHCGNQNTAKTPTEPHVTGEGAADLMLKVAAGTNVHHHLHGMTKPYLKPSFFFKAFLLTLCSSLPVHATQCKRSCIIFQQKQMREYQEQNSGLRRHAALIYCINQYQGQQIKI